MNKFIKQKILKMAQTGAKGSYEKQSRIFLKNKKNTSLFKRVEKLAENF